MKNHLFFVSIFLFYFISCSSESNANISSEKNQDLAIQNGNSLLWKIEGNNCQPSYIFGTMHIIDEEYYHFTDQMREKISKSDAILMEVGGMPNPLETLNLIALDSGDIRAYFTKEQLSEVVAFFDTELNTEPELFYQIYGQMKPFFMLQAITQSYFSENTKSYDLDIMSIAGEEQIPIIGFETIEQQLGFFDQIPAESVAKMVVESIRNFDKEKKETLKMMKIYSEQKVDKLIPLITKQSPEIMEFGDLFLYDRNKAWIPSITKEIENKKCFIAVGAAHLFGDRGVIELLKSEGYQVTAVSTDH